MQIDTTTLDIVEKALKANSRILILGQHFLGQDSKSNPLFRAFGIKTNCAESLYNWWLSGTHDLSKKAKEVMDISNLVQVDEDVYHTTRQPWHAVFTSCIAPVTTRLFEVPFLRMVQPLFRPGFNKASNSVLPLFRLFGSVERTASDELPPCDKNALRQQRSNAASMLSSLFEIAGPNGHILVDGWQPKHDWLRARDMAGSLVKFLPGQVLIFGVSRDEIQDDDFEELIESDVIILFPHSLIEVINELLVQKRIKLDDTLLSVPDTVFYEVAPSFNPNVNRKLWETVPIPRLEWRKWNEGMVILEDINSNGSPHTLTTEERSQIFHDFMVDGSGASWWKWLSELIWKRPVFDHLKNKIIDLVEKDTPQDSTIILYGQSGSGKSVLLKWLALELRRLGLPVIFIEKSLFSPSPSNIDQFSQYVETVTKAPVMVIYDGTQLDQEYVKLSELLASRGRKCVVIGSSYPSQKQQKRTKHRLSKAKVIPLSINVALTGEEPNQLFLHLKKFLPEHILELAKRLPVSDTNNFFAVLYRLLPPAQKKLANGIVDEGTYAASRIHEEVVRSVQSEEELKGTTLMEQLLRKAFQNSEDLWLSKNQTTVTTPNGLTYNVNEAYQLINTVMLVSYLGLELPQNFALRLLPHNSAAVYRGSLQGDIILEKSKNNSIFLSARHELEAKIWLDEKLPDQQSQFELLEKLVKLARASEIRDDDSLELEFMVKLLQAVGPEGNDRTKMPANFYRNIANLIRELREQFKEVHPRLLLLQSHALREWVNIQQEQLDKNTSREAQKERLYEWLKVLTEAEEGLKMANDIVQNRAVAMSRSLSKSAREHLARVETERACVIGARQGCRLRMLTPNELTFKYVQEEIQTTYEEARSAWRKAMRFDEENVNATDAACWICRDRHEIGKMTPGGMAPEQEIELLADWQEVIERYGQLALALSQEDMRDHRELEFSKALGNPSRIEKVASRAASRGSPVAHTFKARYLIETEKGVPVARQYLEEHCNARQYLEGNPENGELERNRAVLLLYTRYWWQTETGYQSYLHEDRMCLAFSPEKWKQLKTLMELRLDLEGEKESGTALLLRACALVHLNQVEEAVKVFDKLDRLRVGGYRRLRTLFLLCNDQGKPEQFSAEFKGMRGSGDRYYVWCDQLRAKVAFHPNEFDLKEVRPGKLIGPFHLAINFRGFFAEPLRRFVSKKEGSTRR